MERRKVRFYVQDTPDAGLSDYPEGVDPTETDEGYYMGIVNEPYGDSTNMISRSMILIEQEDKSIISILPKQLIEFLD